MPVPRKSVATLSAAALIFSASGVPCSQAYAQVLAEGRAATARPAPLYASGVFFAATAPRGGNAGGLASGLSAFTGLIPALSPSFGGARAALIPAQPALSAAGTALSASAIPAPAVVFAPRPEVPASEFGQPPLKGRRFARIEERSAPLAPLARALGAGSMGREMAALGPRLDAVYDGASRGAAADAAGDPFDQSERLKRLIDQARHGGSRPVSEEARNFRILLVPGLGWKLMGPHYFKPAIDFARKHGIEVKLVETDPLGAQDENALVIRNELAASDKRTLVVAHSMGAIHFERTLELFPELRGLVDTFVPIQAPYFGTPYADWYLPRFWVLDVLAGFAKLTHPKRLKGMRPFFRYDTVRELTTMRRGSLPREFPRLFDGIRVFSVASRVRRFVGWAFVDWLRIHLFRVLPQGQSDGVVIAKDAIVPGAPYAILEEVTHWEPVIASASGELAAALDHGLQHAHFAADFFEALLHWRFPAPDPPAAEPHSVEQETLAFLAKLGFKSDREEILAQLRRKDLAPYQAEVLDYALAKAPALDSARELAAKVMKGVAEQGFSAQALDKAADLAARLLALKALRPPARLAEPAPADEYRLLDWMSDETLRRIGPQWRAVVSDVLDTVYGPQDPRRRDPPREEAAAVGKLVWDTLLTMYADSDISNNRNAGRALAAALVRTSRMGRPELELTLQDKLKERGLKLSDYIGDRIELTDRYGRTRRFEFETGDIVGSRTRDLAASEIAVGARPHWSLWPRAWRQRLLGPLLALWIDPLTESPALVAGQPVRNFFRRIAHAVRAWLGTRRIFLRGYSHTGEVEKREADGVSLLWVHHETMDSEEGGIRRDALLHEFLKPGVHVRFGAARLDPERTAGAFLKQAKETGYKDYPFEASDGAWPSMVSRENYEKLKLLARRDPVKFLKVLNRRLLRQIEDLRLMGTGYDHAWLNKLGRTACSSLLVLAHKLANQFEPEVLLGMWHPLVYFLQWWGLPNARGLDLSRRIIWPGSLFVQPNVARHDFIELPVESPDHQAAYTVDEYRERDPILTRTLRTLEADRAALREALASPLLSRAAKRNAETAGWQTGMNDALGYLAGLETLWIQWESSRHGSPTRP